VCLGSGYQMHITGNGKLHDLASVTGFFAQLGIPLPGASAIFISVLEFAGGILFVLDLGSRLIALLFAGDMVMAYIPADRDAVMSIFQDPDKFYDATPHTFLVAALIVLIFGPGKFSLDALLAKRFAGGASSPKASSRA
jgi:putative oxidoreductase